MGYAKCDGSPGNRGLGPLGLARPSAALAFNLRHLRNLCYFLFFFVRRPTMERMPCEMRDPETYAVIGAAMEVHREMGCGFFECPYKDALEIELRLRGIPHLREVELVVFYKGHRLPSFYKADFVCYEQLIVEAKAVKDLTDIDRAQAINKHAVELPLAIQRSPDAAA
jgi:GxxExxY protein